ncbi:MAG: 23S rRNA (guanosine(2251)-2'-O)-methyltransferase RlmB [bacterium]|nr:23S rRNA (guanosine(2251)-2'-O)-methyltransferase RlmB [bacterium]
MSSNIVFGVNAVEEALRAGGRVNRLYLAKESRVRGADALVEEARRQGVPFDFVPQAKLNDLAQTREHQGVVAKVSPAAYTPLDVCLGSCPKKAALVALDRIQHPKNLGMLIRTAVGAGASGILVTARGGALLDDSVVRASAGAVFHIPVVNCKNLTHTLRDLREAGFWNYALAGDGDMTVFDTPWADRTTIVLGNETEGIRPSVRKGCDAAVRIPLAGGFDSLNVAIAGGVALFAASAHLGIV